MKEKIKAIEEYLKYFPQDYEVQKKLKLYRFADELNLEVGKGYFPRMEWEFCKINGQIKAGKKYVLTNSKTKYEFNGNDTIIIWNESCGRLAFVNEDYWYDIEDEWQDFQDVLKSYTPLDYDEINDVYIYDLENGKKLISDYSKILNNFSEKVNKKIKKIEFEKKKKQLAVLQAELAGEENA